MPLTSGPPLPGYAVLMMFDTLDDGNPIIDIAHVGLATYLTHFGTTDPISRIDQEDDIAVLTAAKASNEVVFHAKSSWYSLLLIGGNWYTYKDFHRVKAPVLYSLNEYPEVTVEAKKRVNRDRHALNLAGMLKDVHGCRGVSHYPVKADVVPSMKTFIIGRTGVVLRGQPLVMHERSLMIRELDDLFLPTPTMLFREYLVTEMSVLRYVWAYLNDIDIITPTRPIGQSLDRWLTAWEYISYFGIPLTSPFINATLNAVPLSTPSDVEKKAFHRIFSQISPTMRVNLDIFRGKCGLDYNRESVIGSIADSLVCDNIFTIGFMDRARLKLEDVSIIKPTKDVPAGKKSESNGQPDTAVIRQGRLTYYCPIRTGTRGINGTYFSVYDCIQLVSQESGMWLTLSKLMDIEALTLVSVIFLRGIVK